MKNIEILLLSAFLFGLSCTSKKAEPVAPPSAPAEMIQQPVKTTNPVSEVSSATIGKRTAEEMVAAGFKRYGVEKGTLIFRMDGAVNGTENIYFDHWGWREGKYVNTQSDIGPFDQKTNTIQFLDGERRYEYHAHKAEAHFFESRQVQRAADRYGTKDMTIVGDEMIKNMGGEVVGKKNIMGVVCDLWEIGRYNTKLAMWKGITMGERSRADNLPVSRRCILLDTTSAIPLNKIVLPEGVKLISAN